MRRALLIGSLVVSLVAPGVVHAERGTFFDDNGNRCDINVEEELFKFVCRNPRNFNDFYVCFGEIRSDVTFVDCWSEDRIVESGEEPTSRFLRRIGR